MAADTIPEKSGNDLINLLGLVTGKSGSTNTSGTKTSTTSSNISDAGVKELIDQILQGNGGIASIANAEKSAGLYGGSTATLLTNNLITQAAAKVAVAKAGTTTTSSDNSTTKTKTDPTISPGKAALGLLGGSALNSILQGAGFGGLGGAAGSIGDLLKQGGAGIADLIKGLGGSGLTVDPTGQGTNTTGLTPQQIEQLASQTTPGQDDLSGMTNIPVSALFPDMTGPGFGGGFADYGNPYMAPDDEGSDDTDTGEEP